MAYELKAGEEIRDGVLYGWTGRKCGHCSGYGVDDENYRCPDCGGTGEEWGKMPNQPVDLV